MFPPMKGDTLTVARITRARRGAMSALGQKRTWAAHKLISASVKSGHHDEMSTIVPSRTAAINGLTRSGRASGAMWPPEGTSCTCQVG